MYICAVSILDVSSRVFFFCVFFVFLEWGCRLGLSFESYFRVGCSIRVVDDAVGRVECLTAILNNSCFIFVYRISFCFFFTYITICQGNKIRTLIVDFIGKNSCDMQQEIFVAEEILGFIEK